MHRFFQARNNLTADLIEAGTAISTKDRRWLVNAADRIAERASELSQPFADRSDAVAPQIETLLFLGRRMRRALVWNDSIGYQGARQDFVSLWQNLRSERLSGVPAGQMQTFDQALQALVRSPTRQATWRLYAEVQALRRRH